MSFLHNLTVSAELVGGIGGVAGGIFLLAQGAVIVFERSRILGILLCMVILPVIMAIAVTCIQVSRAHDRSAKVKMETREQAIEPYLKSHPLYPWPVPKNVCRYAYRSFDGRMWEFIDLPRSNFSRDICPSTYKSFTLIRP